MGTDKVAPEITAKLSRRTRLRKRQNFAAEMFREFTRNTGLHGLRYTTESGLSLVEKIFWTTTFLLSCGICFMNIYDVWLKWSNGPVIVTINEELVPIHQIPFPSVTICPQMKCKPNLFNFSDIFARFISTSYSQYTNRSRSAMNFSESEKQEMENIGLACGAYAIRVAMGIYIEEKIMSGNNSIIDHILEVANSCVAYAIRVAMGIYIEEKIMSGNNSIIDHILEVAPDPDEVFDNCIWRNNYSNCSKYFKRVLTSNGVCYNFNALSADEIFRKENVHDSYKYLETKQKSKGWSLIGGYEVNVENSYPYRSHANFDTPDLRVNLIHREGDTLCKDDVGGFKIFLHHPSDMPQAAVYHYAALPDQVSSIAVRADILNSSSKIDKYSEDIRECYLVNERYLRFFKIYTESNCRLECQTNYTYSECGCVWFHMPRDETMPICTIYQKNCLMRALEKMAQNEINENSNGISSTIPLCQCRLSCDSVVYDAEILKTNLGAMKTLNKVFEILIEEPVPDTENYSRVDVFFKLPRFITMRRSELFGTTELLANCGGLLGLFLGFSFMTCIELIYYVTLRLFCTLRRNKKRKAIAVTANEKEQ